MWSHALGMQLGTRKLDLEHSMILRDHLTEPHMDLQLLLLLNMEMEPTKCK